MKTYLLIMDAFPFSANTEIEAENYTEAKLKAFQWACDNSGDRLYDVKIYEVKGTLELDGELNPSPTSAMYFGANLDYNTGKKRTREKKKTVKEQQKRYYLRELQEKIDKEDELVVPYAEMNFRMKFISKEELEAIKKRFNK